MGKQLPLLPQLRSQLPLLRRRRFLRVRRGTHQWRQIVEIEIVGNQVRGQPRLLSAVVDRDVAGQVAVADPSLHSGELPLVSLPQQMACDLVGRRSRSGHAQQREDLRKVRPLQGQVQVGGFKLERILRGAIDRHLGLAVLCGKINRIRFAFFPQGKDGPALEAHCQRLALQPPIRLKPYVPGLLSFPDGGREFAFKLQVLDVVLVFETPILDHQLSDHRSFRALLRRGDLACGRSGGVLGETPVCHPLFVDRESQIGFGQLDFRQHHLTAQQRRQAKPELDFLCLEHGRRVLRRSAEEHVA